MLIGMHAIGGPLGGMKASLPMDMGMHSKATRGPMLWLESSPAWLHEQTVTASAQSFQYVVAVSDAPYHHGT